MHAMLSNDYKRKVCCMAAGAPAAFCRSSRRGFASPQSARSSLFFILYYMYSFYEYKIKYKTNLYIKHVLFFSMTFPSVLWHCWLGDRKGIRSVKFFLGPPLFICPPPEFRGSNELAVVIGISKAKHISKHSHVGELVIVLYKRNKLDNYNKIYY